MKVRLWFLYGSHHFHPHRRRGGTRFADHPAREIPRLRHHALRGIAAHGCLREAGVRAISRPFTGSGSGTSTDAAHLHRAFHRRRSFDAGHRLRAPWRHHGSRRRFRAELRHRVHVGVGGPSRRRPRSTRAGRGILARPDRGTPLDLRRRHRHPRDRRRGLRAARRSHRGRHRRSTRLRRRRPDRQPSRRIDHARDPSLGPRRRTRRGAGGDDHGDRRQAHFPRRL